MGTPFVLNVAVAMIDAVRRWMTPRASAQAASH
jgi:hypothetical protein